MKSFIYKQAADNRNQGADDENIDLYGSKATSQQPTGLPAIGEIIHRELAAIYREHGLG